MIEQKEDFLVTEFVFNIVLRQDWVDDEILMMYEECYRITKRLLIEFGENTDEVDRVRNEIMCLYGQI